MAIAFFVLMPPYYVSQMTKFGEYDIWFRIIVVGILHLLYVKEIYYSKKIDPFLMVFNIYAAIVFIATLRSEADIISAIWGRWIITNAFIILFIVSLKKKQDLFLKSIYVTLLILIVWDASTTLVPKTEWNADFSNLLFGNYNYKAIYYFPAVLAGSVLYIKNKKDRWIKISFIFLQLLILAVLFYVKSATSIVAFSLLLIYLNFFNKEKCLKIFDIKAYVIFNLIFFYIVVIKEYNTGVVAALTKTLNKSNSFSGRIPIWRVTKEYIGKNPIIGYGAFEPDARKALLNNVGASTHAHNFYLNTAFESGIAGLICKGSLAFLAIKKSYKIKNCILRGSTWAVLGALLLAMQFESYSDMAYLSVLLIIYGLNE